MRRVASAVGECRGSPRTNRARLGRFKGHPFQIPHTVRHLAWMGLEHLPYHFVDRHGIRVRVNWLHDFRWDVRAPAIAETKNGRGHAAFGLHARARDNSSGIAKASFLIASTFCWITSAMYPKPS